MNQLWDLFLKSVAKLACAHRWYVREQVGVVCDLCGKRDGPPIDCTHVFERVERLNWNKGPKVIAYIDVLRCTKCGDGRTHVIA